MKIFFQGFRGMLPIVPGIVPFGAVMGTVSADANLSLFQTVTMNILVFAGASQLAAVDLMLKDTQSIVILATGLMINLRFMLYSAAISPVVQKSGFLVKIFTAYLLTDQNYTVMTAHQDRLKEGKETIIFYFGASLCMLMAWHSSVILGFVFGNIAPKAWAIDYAVPLSFVALVVPTFRNYKYILVALFSSIASIFLYDLPFRLGLIVSALLAIAFAMWLTARKGEAL